MTTANGLFKGYLTRGWCTVPIHRPDPEKGGCSCGKAECPNVGKHPDPRFWPAGSAEPGHFADRNVGVRLGPDSGNLADVDCDCGEAVAVGPLLLPTTNAAFGRCGQLTHALFTISDGAAAFLKLQDPVLKGDAATIVELRWPTWDEDEQRFKALQTVFPPSLHYSGEMLQWIRDGEPGCVLGAELVAAVRQVGAAVLVARYARPVERHALVLLVANLLVRAGWADDRKIVQFMVAVFTARKDADKVKKITDGEGANAVKDARDRLNKNKPMTGLPALRDMLDTALDEATTKKVVGKVKEWLNIPDATSPKATAGKEPARGKPTPPRRYTPLPPWKPFPTEHLPTAIRAFVQTVSAAMRCDPTFAALPCLAACAGMIGGTRQIRLKKSWCEPVMTWAVVVGVSGTLKTPPYKRAVAPVLALQAAHFKRHKAEMEEYRAELREYERLKRRAKDEDPGDPPPNRLARESTRVTRRSRHSPASFGITKPDS